MSKIKEIQVKTTYRVGLGNLEEPISEELVRALNMIAKGRSRRLSEAERELAEDFLSKTIHERDAFMWEYEIETLKWEGDEEE